MTLNRYKSLWFYEGINTSSFHIAACLYNQFILQYKNTLCVRFFDWITEL